MFRSDETSRCQRKHGERRPVKPDNEAMWMGFQLHLPSLPQPCRLEQAVESCALSPGVFLVRASLLLLPHLLHLAQFHTVLPFLLLLLLPAQNSTRTLGPIGATVFHPSSSSHATAMQISLPPLLEKKKTLNVAN